LDKRQSQKKSKHELQNGSLSQEDLEIKRFSKATQYDLADFFEDEFFETKKVVHA
jgi:16S rRNA (guanine527-N7)-methyltransferase